MAGMMKNRTATAMVTVNMNGASLRVKDTATFYVPLSVQKEYCPAPYCDAGVRRV